MEMKRSFEIMPKKITVACLGMRTEETSYTARQ
jgi:hypothetical protein